MRFLVVILALSLIISIFILNDFQNNTQKLQFKEASSDKKSVSEINLNHLPLNKEQKKDINLIDLVYLDRLFEIGEYSELTILWQEFQSQNYIEAQSIKRSWLEKGYAWLREDNLLALKNFIDSWLIYSTDDYEFLFLKSQIDLFAGDRIRALNDSFFLLEKLSINKKNFHKRNSEINIKEVLSNLESENLINEAIPFVEQILWHMPNEKKYILKLAELHYLSGNYEFSKNILDTLDYDEKYSKSVNILKSKIRKKSIQSKDISLRKYNSHFVVDGDLNNIKASLLIDTGASTSVIKKSFFDQNKLNLDAKFIRKSFINTAGGQIEAPVYLIPMLSINNYSIQDIEFIVIDFMVNEKIDGLLGMNYLQEFRFEIDQDNEKLKLRFK